MADWRLLARNLALVDGRIGAEESRIIREELWADGKLDKEELQFLVGLRRGAPSVVEEFEDLVYSSLERVLLKDGHLSPEKTEWLKGLLLSDGVISQRERHFLKGLHDSSAHKCQEFMAWCDSLGIPSLPSAYRKPPVTAPPAQAPPAGQAAPPAAGTVTPASWREHLKSPGVISLAAAAFIILLLFVTFLIVVVAAAANPSSPSGVAVGLMVGSICCTPLLAAAGLVFGIVGLTRPERIYRLCALLGTGFHALIILSIAGLFWVSLRH